LPGPPSTTPPALKCAAAPSTNSGSPNSPAPHSASKAPTPPPTTSPISSPTFHHPHKPKTASPLPPQSPQSKIRICLHIRHPPSPIPHSPKSAIRNPHSAIVFTSDIRHPPSHIPPTPTLPAPPLAAFPHFPVTSGTALIAILLFALKLYGQPTAFLEPGPLIMEGHYHLLLSSTLLHGDVFHILFNLFALWTFGTLFERKYGHLRTLLAFLFLGLVSSAFEYTFLRGGVGLSGIVYGLFGFFLARRGLDLDASVVADKNQTILFTGWFLICLIGSWMGHMHIANIAHGMGAVAGIALGRAVGSGRRNKTLYNRAAVALLTLLALAGPSIFVRPYVNFSPTIGFDLLELSQYHRAKGDTATADKYLLLAVRHLPEDPETPSTQPSL
jgi:membrane associated rhomboid family serine protease